MLDGDADVDSDDGAGEIRPGRVEPLIVTSATKSYKHDEGWIANPTYIPVRQGRSHRPMG
jgi:hypothetical protein